MTLITFEIFFLIFLIYSFTGWLIETVGDFVKKKKFINRGFLLGPYCPIYGIGVLLITSLLSKYTKDIIALFFLSAVLCGFLEYFTSYIMEKVFKARWWDYSNMKFNINGRICLETLILFGLSGVLVLHFFNPPLISLISKIPEICLHIISAIFIITFFVDCIVSLKIMHSVRQIKVSVTSQIKDNTDEISSKVREIIMKKSAPYRRLIYAFPQAFADKLKESKQKIEQTAEKVKDNIQEVKDKASDNLQEMKENIQNVKERAAGNIQIAKDKVSDNIQTAKNNLQEFKEKTVENIQDFKEKTINSINFEEKNKFFKNYKSKIKLSLMNIYKNKK